MTPQRFSWLLTLLLAVPPGPARAQAPSTAAVERHLKELELQIDRLTKEVQILRAELKAPAAIPVLGGKTDISVYELKYAKAGVVAKAMQDLFPEKDRLTLRIASDAGLNVLLARGNRAELEVLEACIVRLEELAQRKIEKERRKEKLKLEPGLLKPFLSPTAAVQEPANRYLKEGKLAEEIEVLELRDGIAGFTGTYLAIEPDGSWSLGAVGPKFAKREPKIRGKLTAEQLAQLTTSLARHELAALPNHGAASVNAKVLKVRFGKKVSELQPERGTATAEEDAAIRGRYDAIIQAVKSLCKE
jgi:hypothetical protein